MILNKVAQKKLKYYSITYTEENVFLPYNGEINKIINYKFKPKNHHRKKKKNYNEKFFQPAVKLQNAY